jgi:hypothetical protein
MPTRATSARRSDRRSFVGLRTALERKIGWQIAAKRGTIKAMAEGEEKEAIQLDPPPNQNRPMNPSQQPSIPNEM